MPSSESTADWRLDFLKQYLDNPYLMMTGFHLKVFASMGDSVAVYILKAVYRARSFDQLMAQKILNAVSTAFQYRDSIERPDDRIPAVSRCLLDLLLASAEPEQTESIQAAIDRINGFVGLHGMESTGRPDQSIGTALQQIALHAGLFNLADGILADDVFHHHPRRWAG
jgi:hypothetical protein